MSKPSAYEESYMHVVADASDVVGKFADPATPQKLTRVFSPLGNCVDLYLQTSNHKLCEYAWSPPEEEDDPTRGHARPELVAEYLALHERWPSFIALVERSKPARLHILRTAQSSIALFHTGMSEAPSSDRVQRAKAGQICAALEARDSCWLALK